jgi:hypothetical protein
MVMNANRLVSKRQKMVFDYLVKLKGSYNIRGSQKPMDSGDFICRIVGGGVDQWCFASAPIPDVVDADGMTFAGNLDKTKKGKPAVTLGSLIEISLDGAVVWSAKPVDRAADDDETPAALEPLPGSIAAIGGNGKPAVTQSASTSDHGAARAAGRP